MFLPCIYSEFVHDGVLYPLYEVFSIVRYNPFHWIVGDIASI